MPACPAASPWSPVTGIWLSRHHWALTYMHLCPRQATCTHGCSLSGPRAHMAALSMGHRHILKQGGVAPPLLSGDHVCPAIAQRAHLLLCLTGLPELPTALHPGGACRHTHNFITKAAQRCPKPDKEHADSTLDRDTSLGKQPSWHVTHFSKSVHRDATGKPVYLPLDSMLQLMGMGSRQ